MSQERILSVFDKLARLKCSCEIKTSYLHDFEIRIVNYYSTVYATTIIYVCHFLDTGVNVWYVSFHQLHFSI